MNNVDKKLQLIKSFFLFVLFLILSSLILNSLNRVHAQEEIQMTVVPPRQELNLQAGEKKTIKITFYNKSDSPITGHIKSADFVVLDNNGTPSLLDTSAANNRFAASTWLKPAQDTVSIAAHDQYDAYVAIDVPADAYPCGKYASVYFEPITPTLGGQAIQVEPNSTIAFRLASLLYINVAGQCKENALVTQFTAPSFLEYGPIPVDVSITNHSDYHITPQVKVTLDNTLGKEVDSQGLQQFNIFPDVARNYKAELGSKWMIGRYRIDLAGGYGKTGRTLNAVTYVWVFPWRVALLIVLTLLVIYMLFKSVSNRMNKKSELLEEEIQEEKAEIQKLREALKKRSD